MTDIGVLRHHNVAVFVGEGVLDGAGAALRQRAGGRKALLVADTVSHRLFSGTLTNTLTAAGYAVAPFVMPQGERQKQPALLAALWAYMAERAFTGDDVVLSLGGGAAGDIAMFAGASYMGGLRCALAPTTLLAQLDGGLRGVFTLNLPDAHNALSIKNAPALLLLDNQALSLLPRERMQEGLAEALRSAALFDSELFGLLENTSDAGMEPRLGALVDSVMNIKRNALDGGAPGDVSHALGCGVFLASALQTATDDALTYGRALAVAMCMLTRYTEAVGLSRSGVHARLAAAVSAHGLPAAPPRINRAAFTKAVSILAGGDAPTMRAAYIKDIGQYGVMDFCPADVDGMI